MGSSSRSLGEQARTSLIASGASGPCSSPSCWARADHRLHPLPWAQPVPLRVHGRYSRAEVLAAFNAIDNHGAPRSHREGVLWHEPSQTDLLFITLRKSEALFSPTIRTRDLALGPSLFHWESQRTTTAASPTGQRTSHHAERGSRVLLFVREQRRVDGRPGGVTEPFRCLGFATYESHEGERPMAGDFSGVAAGAADSGGVAAWLLCGTPAVAWHSGGLAV
jgi:hypothetical protein